MNSKVSVIIPNYNYARFVGEAIDSVLGQTHAPHEVIVVDDGSTDDSVKVISAYKEKVKLIQQKNKGVGAARNAGVKSATGEYVSFLDADDLWLPQKLEMQLKLFAADSEVGLITCGMSEFDRNGDTIREYIKGKNGWCATDILLFNEAVVIGPGSASILKRSLFEETGGFDEQKEMHPSEDWEFCYRVARLAKVGFVPEVLVRYRNHGNNGHLQIPRLEKAVLLAYHKIFASADAETLALRGRCYGNLHKTLAASYYHANNYAQFLRHTLKALRYSPGKITYYLKFPLRSWKRHYAKM